MVILAFIGLLWGALTIWRIRLLARFFQIEEYKSGRFLRWWTAKRERWLPTRLAGGALAGFVVAGLLLSLGVDTWPLHLAWWIVVGIAIGWPEPIKEIKKRFVRTQRATRLLATAFTLAVVINVVPALLIKELEATNLEILALVGLLSYAVAPLYLSFANVLMYPVEETLRWGFRTKAKRRLEAAGPIVIGITGSYGKTSTKEYIAHILNGRYKVLATPKSFNTVMGICITINNNLDPNLGYQYFVVEMGAYIRGEIQRICDLTHPQIGVVTAVGPQHLERFGSVENIVEAKYELIKALPPDGVGVFNADDPRVLGMAQRGYPQTRYQVSYADAPDARLVARNVQHTLDGLSFEVVDQETQESRAFRTPLVGLHNVTNILLAANVARHLGMSLGEIALRVASLQPAEHRLKRTVLPNGITVLDDAYNTNPVGAISALEVLSLHQDGRRVLITPGMVELGPLQAEENEKLGKAAPRYCTDIILVGTEQTAPIQQGIHSTDFDHARLQIMETVNEAIAWYQRELKSGDAVLFLNDLSDNYL